MAYTRIVEKSILKLLNKPELVILYGPRRVGKTTVLRGLFEKLRRDHCCASYTLDDPSASMIFQHPSTERLKAIFSEIGFSESRKNYLFLDEVQSFEGIDKLLKLIFDHFSHVKVIATSSSSLLLLQSLTESLAGRKYFLELLPLTLSEYRNLEVKDYFSFPEFLTRAEELTNSVHSFAVFGSFPEVLLIKESQGKMSKLRDILDSSLYKDIFILENIKAPKALVQLVQLLSYQIGNLVNLNEIATQLGISRNTVNEYVSILEKFFIVFRLTPFERNLRSEMTSRFKVYFWDLGVRNAVISRFSPFAARDDRGALFENLVVASILKRNLYSGRIFKTFFWRTYDGFEIDLILENVETEEIWAVQISTSGKTRFSRAFDRYNPTRKIAVNAGEGYRYCL
ncbi:MAG: ATP-binding protein [Armatimonadetes bacterium]|nr:ATP-binding protein [Armatimonadota bacterium]